MKVVTSPSGLSSRLELDSKRPADLNHCACTPGTRSMIRRLTPEAAPQIRLLHHSSVSVMESSLSVTRIRVMRRRPISTAVRSYAPRDTTSP